MEKFKKVWSVITTVLVAIMVLLAIFLMGSRLIGYECYTVISGSMEPTYSVGDLLYVQSVDPTEIKEGDPITFILNEELVVATHRVVRVDAENERFYTKGDANNVEDAEPVHYKNVVGVPQFSIPLIGYISDFVQNPPGMYITIGVGILLLILVFLPDLLAKKNKEATDPELSAAQSEINAANEENERLKAELERLRAEMNAKPVETAESAETTETTETEPTESPEE